ncbi:hypothetical protein FKW77_003193 [Venturia effusa]|uniref:Uncharacterized protein n=1 Tax=Venturia effusa TaxID=50376 RepID=A0A517LIE3_9PEZI|nr:hypothetical protein FKW77_003193 [Venturia effusa]
MRINSYLVTLLLTLAPAAVYAQLQGRPRGQPVVETGQFCSQFMISYQVDCNRINRYCGAGELKEMSTQHKEGLDDAKKNFLRWANTEGNAGTCGGYCTETYKSTPKHFAGSTYYVDCFAARMKDFPLTALRKPLPGIHVAFRDAVCDVFCEPDGKKRTCNFKYDKC